MLEGYMTVMMDGAGVAAARQATETRRYDAADLDIGWAAATDKTRPALCATEHDGASSRATNGHLAITVPAAPGSGTNSVRRTRLSRAFGKRVAGLPKTAAKVDAPAGGGVRLSSHGGYVTADLPAGGGASMAEREDLDGGSLPDWSSLIPTGDGAVIVSLGAAYLAQIAGYFARHGEGKSPGITLTVRGPAEPVVITGMVDGGLGPREAQVVIMPRRA